LIAALRVNFALRGVSAIPAWFIVKKLVLDGKESGAVIVEEGDNRGAQEA